MPNDNFEMPDYSSVEAVVLLPNGEGDTAKTPREEAAFHTGLAIGVATVAEAMAQTYCAATLSGVEFLPIAALAEMAQRAEAIVDAAVGAAEFRGASDEDFWSNFDLTNLPSENID